MNIKRIVANLQSDVPKQSIVFYVDFLGMEAVMERDEIITFAAHDNPIAQLSVLLEEESNVPYPNISVEVSDVDEAHAKAVALGISIVYPLTNEPWGVRRFFVIDPNGMIVNILSHL